MTSSKYNPVAAAISCIVCHQMFSPRWFADHKCTPKKEK